MSYKGFKGNFVRVRPALGYEEFFFEPNGRPKFPLYWQSHPIKSRSWPESLLTENDKKDIRTLKDIPRPMNCRAVLELSRSPRHRGLLQKLMGKYSWRKTLAEEKKKEKMAEATKKLPKDSALIINDLTSSPTDNPRKRKLVDRSDVQAGGSKPLVQQRLDLATLSSPPPPPPRSDEVPPSSFSEPNINLPTHLAHFTCVSGTSSLWGNDFDPQSVYNTSLSSKNDKGLFERMGAKGCMEALSVFQARSWAIAQYWGSKFESELNGVAKLKDDLAKSSASLAEAVKANETLLTVTAETKHQNMILQAQVVEIGDFKKLLQVAHSNLQARVVTLEKDAEEHKLKLEQMEEEHAKVTERLQGELAKTQQTFHDEIEEARKDVMAEHAAGFNKALRQIQLLQPDFDISQLNIYKDVKDGQLVDEDEISDEETRIPPSAEEEIGGEAIVDPVPE